MQGARLVVNLFSWAWFGILHFVGLCIACQVFVGGISDRDGEEEVWAYYILIETQLAKLIWFGIFWQSQVGDFFSQWGLVTLVYRDKASWKPSQRPGWRKQHSPKKYHFDFELLEPRGFVHFATKEGALRVLEESLVLR